MKRHVNAVHNNIKFVCPICKKVYNRKDNLKTHMRTHTRKKLQTDSQVSMSIAYKIDVI